MAVTAETSRAPAHETSSHSGPAVAPPATTPGAVAEAFPAGVRKGRHTVRVPDGVRWGQ